MRFLVASYGTKHIGMLVTHLHSIARSHPDARASVYWQQIPERFIGAIRAAFPRFDFIRTEFDFEGDWIKRISAKVLCWARAAEEAADESQLVFADADTLVLRDVAPFFESTKADIIFTEKPAEPAPLNTGVMLARGGPPATAFFCKWRERTLEILGNDALYRQANDPSLPYGGTDQMSFFQMIGHERGCTDYELRLGTESIRLHAAPCAQLNETNSRPLGDDIHIIHYKGGWQPILLQGRPFSRYRPRAASWEMFALYLRTFLDALARVNDAVGEQFTARDFGIVVPWHFERESGGFRPAGYALWRVREAARRGWLIATGQLNELPR